nr:hypothetical protein OG513_39070 [Streptomyces sp. NBC_00998]
MIQLARICSLNGQDVEAGKDEMTAWTAPYSEYMDELDARDTDSN